MNTEPTVFSKIVDKELPAEILVESDTIMVINNLYPLTPIHLLAISKKPYKDIDELLQANTLEDKDLLWELFSTLSTIAHEKGLDVSGYRLTTNIGKGGGQSIPHLHVHLLGGMNLDEGSLAK